MDLVTQSIQHQKLDPLDEGHLKVTGSDLMENKGDLKIAESANLFPDRSDLMEDVGEKPLSVDGFGPDWHVIDMDYDLETPKTIEGVPPIFVMPPDNFNKTKFD